MMNYHTLLLSNFLNRSYAPEFNSNMTPSLFCSPSSEQLPIEQLRSHFFSFWSITMVKRGKTVRNLRNVKKEKKVDSDQKSPPEQKSNSDDDTDRKVPASKHETQPPARDLRTAGPMMVANFKDGSKNDGKCNTATVVDCCIGTAVPVNQIEYNSFGLPIPSIPINNLNI